MLLDRLFSVKKMSHLNCYFHYPYHIAGGVTFQAVYDIVTVETLFLRSSSDGGKNGTESSGKLACEQLSVPVFTSDGYPMLLDRLFRSRRGSSELLHFYSGWNETDGKRLE